MKQLINTTNICLQKYSFIIKNSHLSTILLSYSQNFNKKTRLNAIVFYKKIFYYKNQKKEPQH